MNRIGIGLIGSGFMGRAHAFAFRGAGGIFALPLQPELEMLADVNPAVADQAAKALGFKHATGDWQQLIANPAVDLVAITAPNTLHKPIALAAIAQGKAVYCEKPLAANLTEAKAMVDAAEEKGVTTLVGFNYLKNPIIALAKEIVASGEIGQITSFRGIHAEDYMADPAAPYSWRCDPGGGVLGDLGSHIISMARYLVGDIDEVCGQMDTVHHERPATQDSSKMRAVSVDDQTHCLVSFVNGARGSLSANWIASGRKMQLAFELVGTKGSLDFTQERFNELKLYTAKQPKGREGFTLITSGPDHPNYGAFCPAPGHQLGFNDLKTIEVKELIEAMAESRQAYPDFREAWEIERIVEAIRHSATDRRWVRLAEV